MPWAGSPLGPASAPTTPTTSCGRRQSSDSHVISSLVMSIVHVLVHQGDSNSENLISSTSTWFQVVPFCSLVLEQFLFLLYDLSFPRLYFSSGTPSFTL